MVQKIKSTDKKMRNIAPRPWQAFECGGIGYADADWLCDEEGFLHAEPFSARIGVCQDKETAEYIVKCVNLHDDLVYALKQCANNWDINTKTYVQELIERTEE